MQATFLSLLPTHALASVSAYDSFLLLSTAPSQRAASVTTLPQVIQVAPVAPVASVASVASVAQVSQVPQVPQVPQVSQVPQVPQVPQATQGNQVSEESVISDRQRFASTLFSLCKELAFKAAKNIFSSKKVELRRTAHA